MRAEYMARQTCVGCKFMLVSAIGKDLQKQIVCLRFPPTVSSFVVSSPAGPAIANATQYPTINENTAACGEFKEKEAANA